MLKIAPPIQEKINAHGLASYPFEGCGLLLGVVQDGVHVVQAVKPLANVWPDEEEKRYRFRINETDWRDAEVEAMIAGLDVLGIFHSHPDNPPIASPRDLAWAAWAGYSYLITEINEGRVAESRSWQLLPDRSGFVEEEIIAG